MEVTVEELQATLSAGQHWEMVKALVDRLPKEGQVGYQQDPGFFNRVIADLVKLDPHSEESRQIRWILSNGSFKGVLNPFADEKVEPRFFYPEGYKPNSVKEQVAILLGGLDWLDTSHVQVLEASWGSYEKADGLYVVPKPTVLAAHLGIEDPWTNFGLLTEKGPLETLGSARTFTNHHARQMGADRYRLSDSARAALQALEANQPGDLLVFPAQIGMLYAGFSTRNARWDIEHAANPGQWPQPCYCVGWMVYANAHRLTAYEHLCIDCPGDELRLGASGGFGRALCFSFHDGELRCGSGSIGDAHGSFGSASGFVRQ